MPRPPVITIESDDDLDDDIEAIGDREPVKYTVLAEHQAQWGGVVYLNCGTYDTLADAERDATILENRDGKATHVVVFRPRQPGPRLPNVNV